MKIKLKEIAWIIGAFVVLVIFVVIFVMTSAKSYKAHINLPGGTYRDIRVTQEEELCDMTVLSREGRNLVLLLENGRPGTTTLTVECIHKENQRLIDVVVQSFTVTERGMIFFGSDSDFSGHPVIPGAAALFMLLLGVKMAMMYRRQKNENPFSYGALVRLSLATYFILQGALCFTISAAGLIFRERMTAFTCFLLFGLIMTLTVLVLIPFILIFALVMGVSNLALIRHEGFRFSNGLGFLISGLMLVGGGAILLSAVLIPGYLDLEPSEFVISLLRVLISPLFVYMICLLFATELSLFRVTRHEPPYDRDFIIILGCRVREDGTLYPLIKGRADRAIAFFRTQLQTSGKRAVFVPSGGQGTDERISEGEAVKNYLISQGFSETDIMAETESKTTLENMKFSKALIEKEKKDAKVVFSTTNYHIFRSGMIANQAGVFADGIGSRTKWYYSPNAQIREFIGLLAARWKTHAVIVLLLTGAAVLFSYTPMLVRTLM